uniref:Uncharacterized protein n=1 Tax=Siphoviridae sp. ctFIm6 TaxID=2827818 RepID=A0A8S5SJ11_9CAUD|nr:MAG TPA: hypothetical protein [Siphoviridae sp. ctFIm6]
MPGGSADPPAPFFPPGAGGRRRHPADLRSTSRR